MTDQPADPVSPEEPAGTEEDVSLGAVFARLANDARAYVEAEGDRQKLRASLIAAGVRDAAILIVIAITLGTGTIVALLVGLIIALAPILTPLGAIGAVLGSALTMAAILLLLARARIARMKRDIRP
ncbi:putative membrane protein [Sphingobium fontiphilum]|uniref:Putative membrane protein n=1 Tax=Sphingobium fontiphilum TaxID=944425 RepID=A0A7W6DD41_9SPHN|nr:putative membrane protein [Sphingobium fontiphilum]